MVNEFKANDKVAHENRGNGVVIGFQRNIFGECWPVVEYESGHISVSAPSLLRPRNFLAKIAEEQKEKESLSDEAKDLIDKLQAIGAFKTVDQQFNIAGEGLTDDTHSIHSLIDAVIETYDTTREMPVLLSGEDSHHGNKTVDQQFNEVFKPSAAGVDPAYGDGIAGQMVMTKSGWKQYITDAYGIKRDPVTLLEIESDGLVKISSIKDTIRSMG